MINKLNNKNLLLCKLKEFEKDKRRNSSETKSIQNDCKLDNVLLDDKNEIVDKEVLHEVSKISKLLLTGLLVYLKTLKNLVIHSKK